MLWIRKSSTETFVWMTIHICVPSNVTVESFKNMKSLISSKKRGTESKSKHPCFKFETVLWIYRGCYWPGTPRTAITVTGTAFSYSTVHRFVSADGCWYSYSGHTDDTGSLCCWLLWRQEPHYIPVQTLCCTLDLVCLLCSSSVPSRRE